MVRIRDVCNLGVQVEAWVIITKESRRKLFNNEIQPTLINNQVIVVAEIIEGQVIARTAKDKRALYWGVSSFKV